MFPLIGILVAAGLLFKLRHKAAPTTTVVSKPTSPTKQAPTATTTITAVKKPAAKPSKATVRPATTTQTGYVTPSTNAQVNDLLGQFGGTNPRVLNPTLPIGQYDPSTNTAGYQTPPIVAQTSPFNR